MELRAQQLSTCDLHSKGCQTLPSVSADLINQLDEERVAEYRAHLLECFPNVRCTKQKEWQMGGADWESYGGGRACHLCDGLR